MNSITKLFILLACVCVVSCAKDSYELSQGGQDYGNSILDTENQVTARSTMTGGISTVRSQKVLASDVPTILKNQLGINEARSSKRYSLNTIQKNGNPMLHVA